MKCLHIITFMDNHILNRRTSRMSTGTMVSIGLVTAVTCILAPLTVPIPVSPVPITLTNLVLFISIYVLGWKNAVISLLIYLLLGLVGLPIFSGFSGGPGKFAGPTGGYLIGFIFMVIVAGLFIHRFPQKRTFHLMGMVLASIITYIFGTAWLAIQMNLAFSAALSIGVLPYIIGDVLKIIIALIVGPILKNRLAQI